MVAKDPGLLGETRSRILQLLRTEARSAKEVALVLGIQVSAVRKHLDRLEKLGAVAPDFRKQQRGRPSKWFALTDQGREMFPRRYDAVLDSVLSALAEERGAEYAESVLRRIARRTAGSKGARPDPRGRLRSLLEALNDLGFEAGATRKDGAVVITSRNCPILRVASNHREVVCRGLHAGLIESGMGADVKRERWILDGEPVCTHIVRLGASPRRPDTKA